VEAAFAINITSNGVAVPELLELSERTKCLSVYWRSSSDDDWQAHIRKADTHVFINSTIIVPVSMTHFSDYVVVAHYPAFERLGKSTITPGKLSTYYGPTDPRNKPLTDAINARELCNHQIR
jgi:hypothetical protein